MNDFAGSLGAGSRTASLFSRWVTSARPSSTPFAGPDRARQRHSDRRRRTRHRPPTEELRPVRRPGRRGRRLARLSLGRGIGFGIGRACRYTLASAHRPRRLAQSAERLTRNEKVVGSIPTGGSTQTPRSEATFLARGFLPSNSRGMVRGTKVPTMCGMARGDGKKKRQPGNDESLPSGSIRVRACLRGDRPSHEHCQVPTRDRPTRPGPEEGGRAGQGGVHRPSTCPAPSAHGRDSAATDAGAGQQPEQD